MNEPSGRVTTRELYDELNAMDDRVENRLDGLRGRLTRVEAALAVLTALVLSPKVGGPAPDQVVASLIQKIT